MKPASLLAGALLAPALGRDGKTEIWGVIIRPTNFDSTRTYPVVENIYAGPQGSFVPKTFSTQLGMQSLAAKYPYYDISRVGIYGTSAGGQNSMGALLFHPELYKVAVSAAGCHDNRMDKIWWNEQWMGEVGPHYSASSHVDNAYRLQGKLMLVVGEMDMNVDPASTFQVVNALNKANKMFDLLVIPGRVTRAAVRTESESATTSSSTS